MSGRNAAVHGVVPGDKQPGIQKGETRDQKNAAHCSNRLSPGDEGTQKANRLNQQH